MKRILLGVLAVGIVLTIGATTAFASGMHNGYGSAIRLSSTAQTGSCPNYVDADGDGICDNCSGSHGTCLNNGSCSNYVDADGDGLCDNCSGSHGTCQTGGCSNYVDTDGDGLCDNCSGSHGNCQTGSCPNYVDADGDGLCDNYSEDRYGCGNKAAWSGAGQHNGCREECRESRCGANRR